MYVLSRRVEDEENEEVLMKLIKDDIQYDTYLDVYR